MTKPVTRYVMSSLTGSNRIPKFRPEPESFGGAHYSWAINASLYRRGLETFREIREIVAPDIYQDPIAKKLAGLDDALVHLCDKPLELMRPLFGNVNVSIMVWEFAEFSSRSHRGDPTKNQIAMLGAMDDVWCGSSFTQKTLAAHGIIARFLPPPVAAFVTDDVESIGDVPIVRLDTANINCTPSETIETIESELAENTVFVSVLAPFDLRKNFRSLVEGFLASEASQSSILLIKLIVDNKGTTVANVNGILKVHFDLEAASDRVIFCGAYLTDQQMNALYDLGDFYVTSSSAEGLNLPAIECMAREIPIVSTDKTAMADYINSDTATVIASKRVPTTGAMHAFVDVLDTTHYPPSVDDLASAFDRAHRLTQAERRKMAENGCNLVKELYGIARFQQKIEEFESSLA